LLSSRSPALPPGLAPPDKLSQKAGVDPEDARNWQDDVDCAKAVDEIDSRAPEIIKLAPSSQASAKNCSAIVEEKALVSECRAPTERSK
jgi:hypothetical protein